MKIATGKTLRPYRPKSKAWAAGIERWRRFFQRRREMLNSITDEKLKKSAERN